METTVQRMVPFDGQIITYELQRKQVRNVNLRVRADGSVSVSAPRRVSLAFVDAFVAQKGAFIRAAQARCARERDHAAALPAVPRQACLDRFTQVTAALLPLLAPYGVTMPQVKLRSMKSRWGSCAYKTGSITLNTKLYHAPETCLEYVVLHELCHFVHPNHSPAFHGLLSALMPNYKQRKRELETWNEQGKGGEP